MGSLAIHLAAARHVADMLLLLVVSTCVPASEEKKMNEQENGNQKHCCGTVTCEPRTLLESWKLMIWPKSWTLSTVAFLGENDPKCHQHNNPDQDNLNIHTHTHAKSDAWRKTSTACTAHIISPDMIVMTWKSFFKSSKTPFWHTKVVGFAGCHTLKIVRFQANCLKNLMPDSGAPHPRT